MNIVSQTENKLNPCLPAALEYLKLGFSVFPIGTNKKPLKSWKEFQQRFATVAEVEQWFKEFPEANVGIVTGAISKIVVVDVEKVGSTEGLTPTVMSSTGGGGFHFYYKHPGFDIRNDVKKLRKLTDFRGDGGYVVAPPSIHPSGKLYEWQVLPGSADFADLPDWILKAKRANTKAKVDWREKLTTAVSEGSRNNSAAENAGKILSVLPQELWESEGWPFIQNWNSKNKPPMSFAELRGVWHSITLRQLSKTQDTQNTVLDAVVKDEEKKQNQANKIIDLILDSEAVLFNDGKESYIAPNGNGSKVIPIESSEFKNWLGFNAWQNLERMTISRSAKEDVVGILNAKALYEGKKFKLETRISKQDNVIWYDLGAGKAIKITADGWRVTDRPPIVFRWFDHQQEQVVPVAGGSLDGIFDYLPKPKYPEQELLLLVWLVVAVIQGFPHPMLSVYGQHGAGKSTLCKLIRLLLDPSVTLTLTPHSDMAQFIQQASHHFFLPIDNLSYVKNDFSDILARIITGDGFSKRKHYHNDDDFVYSVRKLVAINGINTVVERPDLLSRTLLVEIPKPQHYVEEEKLYIKFNEQKPVFFGGLLDLVVETLKIKAASDDLKDLGQYRMADFVRWGAAAAQALGFTVELFLKALESNRVRQHEAAINASLLAQLVIKYMEFKTEWSGEPADLYNGLITLASTLNMHTPRGIFPQAPSAMSKELRSIANDLHEIGLDFVFSPGLERNITITKTRTITVNLDIAAAQSDIALEPAVNTKQVPQKELLHLPPFSSTTNSSLLECKVGSKGKILPAQDTAILDSLSQVFPGAKIVDEDDNKVDGVPF